ncbi:hypothetical protein BHM03_00024082 [Ensete ventricosum]|nr:hypothetical protein BHM03_00024082 [Ensete ventricosum]
MGGSPTDLGGSAARNPGTGGLPACPERFNRPVSRVHAVYPPTLSGSTTVNCPKTWVAVIYLSVTDGLPTEISEKVVPSTFRILA